MQYRSLSPKALWVAHTQRSLSRWEVRFHFWSCIFCFWKPLWSPVSRKLTIFISDVNAKCKFHSLGSMWYVCLFCWIPILMSAALILRMYRNIRILLLFLNVIWSLKAGKSQRSAFVTMTTHNLMDNLQGILSGRCLLYFCILFQKWPCCFQPSCFLQAWPKNSFLIKNLLNFQLRNCK